LRVVILLLIYFGKQKTTSLVYKYNLISLLIISSLHTLYSVLLHAAAIDGVVGHLLEVVRELPALEIQGDDEVGPVHVDGAPHRRVLAEVVPLRAHHLCARQDLEYLQSHQDRRRQVQRQSQPVVEFVRRRVHSEIFCARGIGHGQRSLLQE